MRRKAIVIGAGIGGLSAAIALREAGWDVDVFDKASVSADNGAGIVLAANAMKALAKLGAAEAVAERGAAVGKAEIRTWDGKLLVELPALRQAARYGTHSYLIHRAELRSILLRRWAEAGGSEVRTEKELAAIEQDARTVAALFHDGTRVEGHVLVGADGVRSAARERLVGPEPLRYGGFTALRGLCEYADERYAVEDGGGFEALGPGRRFGFSHLGGGRVFWFAAINAPPGDRLSPKERKEAAQRHFRGWYEPVRAVIDATAESAILAHDLFDRKPLTRWSYGRATLLGDAAHPMMPNLGQGGAQALEDAIVLARSLRPETADVAKALQAYERARIPRTTAIVKQSRRMGKLMQLENGIAIAVRNWMLRTVPPAVLASRLDGIVGADVD
ncbi:FAD-dependent monooxygenase [Paenibacillus flagellatus]|uniref:2-polyprenyl-6-methoxyphenol hydroxylase n=1 Tax=Paenibacillus flagellatus TaxID=2211139 RepID=A0A2V5K665_9BACL|nr:FAD-dependent monooxygenase [Paenibacillus flagellatus]PYI54879.1 2-polyprenyl-6-methoxyphenol hydroxylase [Paenibacillus flagellatus]